MSPVNGTQTGVHIRNKPKTRTEQSLRDRPDLKSRFSALPWTVLTDRNLKPMDWGVYCCLSARAFKGDSVSIGLRWIADSLGIGRMTAKRSLDRLLRAGHVEVRAEGSGSRASVYRLTSAVFAKRQRVILASKRGNLSTTRYDVDCLRERIGKIA